MRDTGAVGMRSARTPLRYWRRLAQRCLWFAQFFCVGVSAQAQSWQVSSLGVGTAADGAPAQTQVAVLAPEDGAAVKHVIVVPLTAPQSLMKAEPPTVTAVGPWARGAAALSQAGVAIVLLDMPSDAEARALNQRPIAQVRRDLEAGSTFARKRFAKAGLHMGLFHVNAPVIEAAAAVRGVERIVVASALLADARTVTLAPSKVQTLLVQAPTAQCESSPALEAEQFARRHGFAFARAGYSRIDALSCAATSQHALRGLEDEFAKLVVRWVDGSADVSDFGALPARVAWQEQIVHFDSPGAIGTLRLEMTLLLPENASKPVPVVVFNHGDMEIDFVWIRYQRRFRDLIIAREFLRLGVAVAFPARRGVGMSEGTYPRGFQRNDGDATYKGRVHATDIVPAIQALQTRPEIDGQRVLVAGQSAGGYSSMYIASLGLPGVVGVINFSGGRTDAVRAGEPGYKNAMMIDGFAQLGRVTRVPALLVFGENDRVYSDLSVRASHEAFVAAGGKAELVMVRTKGGDGHFAYHEPELWRPAFQTYLTTLGAIGRP
jgi:dienelactone hydrolase